MRKIIRSLVVMMLAIIGLLAVAGSANAVVLEKYPSYILSNYASGDGRPVTLIRPTSYSTYPSPAYINEYKVQLVDDGECTKIRYDYRPPTVVESYYAGKYAAFNNNNNCGCQEKTCISKRVVRRSCCQKAC